LSVVIYLDEVLTQESSGTVGLVVIPDERRFTNDALLRAK
ncbi:9262_t:CDS:1, partial [Racocetra persica]